MSSRLEQFMNSHRDEFDSDLPSDKIWNKIQDELKEENKAPVKNIFNTKLLIAAATIAVAGMLTFYFLRDDHPQHQLAVTEENTDLIHDINPEYAKEVYHFTQIIELKQNELKKLEKADPNLYKRFLTDITTLDSSYNALKKELPTNPNREQLLEVMIQNLRLQTELLNEQLLIIQKIKNTKNQNDETNSKSI